MDNQSEQIEKISLALCKAQSQIQGAIKDSKNPYFNSSYADLASVWEAIRKPLTDNELSVVQIVDEKEGNIFLITQLNHSSGQWFTSRMPLIFGAKKDMQALGSALTYSRRYSLAAIMGVPQVDDDGNACSSPKKQILGKDILRQMLIKLTDNFKDTEKSALACDILGIVKFSDIGIKTHEQIKQMIDLLKEKEEEFY